MARVIIALGAACPVPVGRESGRPGRARAYAGTDGIERELVVNHALGYDGQQVYLVTLAAKLAQGPVDHHLAVRRAVDREQDLAQRRGMFGLVRGGHLGPGGERQPADGTFRFGNSERPFSVAPRGGGGRSWSMGRARTMTGTATFVASSATRARIVSDLASRVVPVMARGEKSCGRGRGVVALSCSFGT